MFLADYYIAISKMYLYNYTLYTIQVVEYILSILPHNRVVHWLCCNNSHVLSDMLLSLAHLQSSNKGMVVPATPYVHLCLFIDHLSWNLNWY